mmetsp:Transcript_14573/g.45817  ORF Transcript_14573/g.45817 Transcript_14573/m.45817 type:complete len:448 (-) Transcript_14573:111-1454(-)
MPARGRFSQWPPPEASPSDPPDLGGALPPPAPATSAADAPPKAAEAPRRSPADDSVLRPRRRPRGAPPEELVRRLREAAEKSPLLVELRALLAEAKVQAPPREYTSFCRHVAAEACRLPVADVTRVPCVERVPAPLRIPVLVEPRAEWPPLQWGLDYWRREHGGEVWQCFRRYPPSADERGFEADKAGVRVGDFVDYVGVLEDVDPQCLEDNSMAFPRFMLAGWQPFASTASGRRLWENDWASGRRLWAPPGIEDLTTRWVHMACDTLGHARWDSMLSGFDRLQLSPAGAVCRLHVNNASAHAWYGQIEGQSVFFLFPPHEGANLYGKTKDIECFEERRHTSPVDIFDPNAAKHPNFKNTKAMATLLEPGEILVVPSGWWIYSATLEPSVVLCRRFWNRANKAGICEEFANLLLEQELAPGMEEVYRRRLLEVRDLVEEDAPSDDEP